MEERRMTQGHHSPWGSLRRFPVDFTSSPLSAPCEQAAEIHGRVRHGCGNRNIVNPACLQRGEHLSRPSSAVWTLHATPHGFPGLQKPNTDSNTNRAFVSQPHGLVALAWALY